MILVILLLETAFSSYSESKAERTAVRSLAALLITMRFIEMVAWLYLNHNTSFISVSTFLGVPFPEYGLLRIVDTLFALILFVLIGIPALVLSIFWGFLVLATRVRFVQKLYFAINIIYAQVKYSFKNIFNRTNNEKR